MAISFLIAFLSSLSLKIQIVHNFINEQMPKRTNNEKVRTLKQHKRDTHLEKFHII